MTKKKLTILGLVLALILIIVTGCTPKALGQWVPDTSTEIATVPSDACVINGMPQIININTESDGGFSLVYVRNNGDIVVKAWLPDPVLGMGLHPAGEFYWTGGHCPAK